MSSPHNNVGPWASLQHQEPFFRATVSQPTIQQSIPPGDLSNQVCLIKLLYQMFCQSIQMSFLLTLLWKCHAAGEYSDRNLGLGLSPTTKLNREVREECMMWQVVRVGGEI